MAKRTTINQESNTFYIHTDRSSFTRLVTDDNKNIVAAVTYHPFGEPSTEEGSEQYLFTGKEKDSTDLYYYGARYYDPEIGIFLTRDPYTSLPDDPRIVGDPEGDCTQWLMNPQKFNRFSYAANNPLKYNDPTGLHYSCIGDDCEELVGELREQNYLRRKKIEDGKKENVGSALIRALHGIEALYGIGNGSGGGSGSGRNCYWVVYDCDGKVVEKFPYTEGDEESWKDAHDDARGLQGFYRLSECPYEAHDECYRHCSIVSPARVLTVLWICQI